MMGFLKRMIMADSKPTVAEQESVAASKRELDQTRGDYRQAVQRVESNMRVMKTWENANRMVRE